MAQLKDTVIDGTLNISSDIILQINGDILGIHPNNNDAYSLISMSTNGNTIIGYNGYENRDSNTNIYGEDINHCVASAGVAYYRPYYRAGDSLSLDIHTSGYVTNSCKDIYFYLPFSKPIIGSPVVTITSDNGMLLRQDGKYTHGSSGSPTAIYAKPNSYTTAGDTDWNGVCVKATFSNVENAVNNTPAAVFWSGTITFS